MIPTTAFWPWALLTLLALVAYLAAEYTDSVRAKYVLKPLASAGFLGAAIASGALATAYGLAVLAALLLSWLGDVFLLSRQASLFLAGLASFLLAHVAYGVAFTLHGQDPLWFLIALGALIIPAAVVARWLRPHVTPRMKWPVGAYIAMITLMLALALGTRQTVIGSGALAFYISDISVARDRFVHRSFVNRLWGLPLYYLAQLLLAATVAS
jgi:uncharacterized membrane protein YhhN